jgi:hypothetical protein
LAEAGVPKVDTVAKVLLKFKATSTLRIFLIRLLYKLHQIHMATEIYPRMATEGALSNMGMLIAAPTAPHFYAQSLQKKPTYLLFDAISDRL